METHAGVTFFRALDRCLTQLEPETELIERQLGSLPHSGDRSDKDQSIVIAKYKILSILYSLYSSHREIQKRGCWPLNT
jgi:hypothetical protein